MMTTERGFVALEMLAQAPLESASPPADWVGRHGRHSLLLDAETAAGTSDREEAGSVAEAVEAVEASSCQEALELLPVAELRATDEAAQGLVRPEKAFGCLRAPDEAF
jgi:hypothetical protein